MAWLSASKPLLLVVAIGLLAASATGAVAQEPGGDSYDDPRPLTYGEPVNTVAVEQIETGTPTPADTADSNNTTDSTETTTETITAVEPSIGTETETPTGTGTPAPSGNASPVDAEAIDLTTYTNERYPYSIERPAGWESLVPGPQTLFLSDAESVSAAENYLQVRTSAANRSFSVAELNGTVVPILENSTADFETLSRGTVTLANGQRGLLINATYDYENDAAGPLRGKYLVVSADSRLYIVQVAFAQSQYTPEVDEVATAIVESFTVNATGNGSTVTPTTT